jgi:hypothetical protein
MFKKSKIGIDISDDVIRFVELIKDKTNIKVGSFGEKKIPEGIVEFGEIKDVEKIQEILTSIKKEYKIKFSHIVSSLELKGQAIYRAVVKEGDLGTYMIIDFSKKHVNIFVVSMGVVKLAFVLDIDGIFSSDLYDAIKRHFIYWHTQKDADGKNKLPIEKVILCGSDFNITKIPEDLSITLRHKVELADVWSNILDTGKNIPPINFEESLSFATALGAALESFDK